MTRKRKKLRGTVARSSSPYVPTSRKKQK